MKIALLGLLLLTPYAYGQTPQEIVKTAEVSGVKHDYVCQKGSKEIKYRISFKDAEGQPPCKVYELYQGSKTKKIGQSTRTPGICEDIIERLIKRLEAEGMTCTETVTD